MISANRSSGWREPGKLLGKLRRPPGNLSQARQDGEYQSVPVRDGVEVMDSHDSFPGLGILTRWNSRGLQGPWPSGLPTAHPGGYNSLLLRGLPDMETSIQGSFRFAISDELDSLDVHSPSRVQWLGETTQVMQALLLQTNWGTEAATRTRDTPSSTCQGWI